MGIQILTHEWETRVAEAVTQGLQTREVFFRSGGNFLAIDRKVKVLN